MGVEVTGRTRKLVLAASFAAGLALTAAHGFAADVETLIEKMHEKGLLTDEEYQEMRSQAREERRKEALKDAQAEEKAAKAKEENQLTGRFRDGFTWESADKQHSFSVNGRIQADYRTFSVNSTNANSANTFDVRRAYIGAGGRVYNDWTFEVTADVAQTTAPQLDVAWINYEANRGLQFRAGQFKIPMALEELTSSRFIDFQERSFVDFLVPAKERGAMIHGSPWNGVYYGLALSNGTGKNNNETSAVQDSKDFIGRLALNFAEMMGNKDMVLHVAGAYSNGTTAGGTAPIGSGIRTEGRGLTFFTTAALPATDIDRTREAAELSLAWKQFKVQGEWINVNFQTPGLDNDISAEYAEVMWLITGEKYADAYRGGAYGTIRPNRPFKKGAEGWGAWEVGVRYSKFDAGDFVPTAGQTNKADAMTVGLKWLPNTNTRVYLNYVQTNFDTPVTVSGGTTEDEKAITMRLGFYF
jgi:phosphate-selective porin OprO and OprP